MKDQVELFRTSVGSVILPATMLDPDLRRSPIRGAVVVAVAVTFGVLVVGAAVAYKNMTVVRNFFAGDKSAT